MSGLFSSVEHHVRDMAFAAVIGVVGIALSLAGVGFLTVSLWMVVAALENPLVAYTVIGIGYLFVGILFLALGRHQTGQHAAAPERRTHVSEAPKEPFEQIAEGFAIGLQAGRAARQSR